MSLYNREEIYIKLLSQGEHTVADLAEKLFISLPTVRRDLILLEKKQLIDRKRGKVTLKTTSADKRIPLFVRDMENTEEKKEIALKAVSYVNNGDVIMLDASTSAYFIVPYLANFKDLIVITNGAKTAIELADFGIKTISLGGELTCESFSYIGPDAEATLRRYNADIAFFSCRGISQDGMATDNSVLENSVRKIMIKQSKKSYLLCDKSKFNKRCLNLLCDTKDIAGVITNN